MLIYKIPDGVVSVRDAGSKEMKKKLRSHERSLTFGAVSSTRNSSTEAQPKAISRVASV